MKRSLTFVASVLALSAGPAFAQTADHAPTKPAADAAARYDRSMEKKPDPANAAKGSDDSSSGASSGTKTEPAPGNSEKAAPNSSTGKPE